MGTKAKKPKINFFEAVQYAMTLGKITNDVIADVADARDPESDQGEKISRKEIKEAVMRNLETLVDFIADIVEKKFAK